MLFSSVMHILKPSPSAPIKLSAGTRKSSKVNSPVGEAWALAHFGERSGKVAEWQSGKVEEWKSAEIF